MAAAADKVVNRLHLSIDGHDVYTRLIGEFNASNLLAVYGTAILLGEQTGWQRWSAVIIGFVGGSMGDISVILRGVESEESREAMYSTVHGAGRVMSRTQAAGKQKWVRGNDGRKRPERVGAGRVGAIRVPAEQRGRDAFGQHGVERRLQFLQRERLADATSHGRSGGDRVAVAAADHNRKGRVRARHGFHKGASTHALHHPVRHHHGVRLSARECGQCLRAAATAGHLVPEPGEHQRAEAKQLFAVVHEKDTPIRERRHSLCRRRRGPLGLLVLWQRHPERGAARGIRGERDGAMQVVLAVEFHTVGTDAATVPGFRAVGTFEDVLTHVNRDDRVVVHDAIAIAFHRPPLDAERVLGDIIERTVGRGGVVLVPAFAAAAAVIVTPAMIVLLGDRLDSLDIRRLLRRALNRPEPNPKPVERQFWYRSTKFVMRRAVTIGLTVTAFLIFLGLPFLRIQFGNPDDRVLPSAPARVRLRRGRGRQESRSRSPRPG